MGILVSKKDTYWLKENFEDCNITLKPFTLTWRLHFTNTYNDITISDSYDLSFKSYNDWSIVVFETWGKIQRIAKKLSLPLQDLHINSTDSSLCLGLPQLIHRLLWNSYSIVEYIETLVIPFLFATTFLYKYKVRPWWEYEHWILWYLSAYANNEINYQHFKYACKILRDDPCKIKIPFPKSLLPNTIIGLK